MTRSIFFIAGALSIFLLCLPSTAIAELNIVGSVNDERARLHRDLSSQRQDLQGEDGQLSSDQSVPELLDFVEMLSEQRPPEAASDGQGTVAGLPFAENLIEQDCTLVLSSPAGVLRTEGGLNGRAQVLECARAIIILSRFEYVEPLTQKVTVYDPEYVADPVAARYRIKRGSIRYENALVWSLGWIHPTEQITVEIYDYDFGVAWADRVEVLLDQHVRQLPL